MNERTRDNADRAKPRQERRREFRSIVRWIGVTLLLAIVPFAFMRWLHIIPGSSMIGGQATHNDRQADLKRDERREFLSYIWGFGLALLLTVVPFALVHWFPGIPRISLLIVIGAFALVQMLVHFRFFLHVGFRQKREDLQLLLFSALLLAIMVGGTVWIMASLALRMAVPASF